MKIKLEKWKNICECSPLDVISYIIVYSEFGTVENHLSYLSKLGKSNKMIG